MRLLGTDYHHKRKRSIQLENVDESGELMTEKITAQWVQRFIWKHQMLLKACTGKNNSSTGSRYSFHSKWTRISTTWSESSNLVISTRTHREQRQNSLHYWFLQQNDSLVSRREADLVWRCRLGGDGMEMVIRLFCGSGARILPWMIIFTNRQSKHTIREIPESSLAFWDRSGLEGCLIKRIYREFLRKWRASTSDRHSTERSTFLDSCSNHLTEGEFESELRKMKMCTLGLSSLLLLRPIFVNRRTLSSLPRLIMSGVTGRKWRRLSLSKEMDGQTHRVTTGRGEEF